MATQPIEAQPVPDAVIAAGAEEAPASGAQDFEAEARIKGWKPPEEFEDGERRPRVIKTAEEFLRAEEEVAGFQKKTIARMAEEIKFLKRQQKHLMQAEQNTHANVLEEIKAQMKEAVATGDVAAFDALDAKADRLRKDSAPDKLQGENPVEELATFREENPWFDKANLASASEAEVEARLFADRLADKWIGQGLPNEIPPSEFYKRLADEVKAKYPNLGRKAPVAKPASDVAGVTTRTTARSNVTLSREEMDQAERYMRLKIPGFKDCKSKAEAHQLFAKLGEQ